MTFSEAAFSGEPPDVAVRASALALLLPLVFFGATLWIAQHEMIYATTTFSDDEEVDLSPTPARQVSFVALGVFGIIALLKPAQGTLAVSRRHLALLLSLCLLIVLSAFWSDDFELSLKRSLIPVLTLLGALGAAKHWRTSDLCWFVLLLTSIFLLLGVGAELASGAFLNRDAYRFSGTLHPNSQGVNCAALALAALALSRDSASRARPFSRLVFLGLFGIGTLFLLLTKSRTATAAFLAALLFFFTMGMPRGKKFLVVMLLAMFLAAGLLGMFAFGAEDRLDNLLLQAVQMGRNQETEQVSSLTGRIPIWQEILNDVAERPLIGYGYGGFWTPYRVMHYSYIHDWEFTHAHSAYLETLLHIGVVGLALGLLLFLSLIRAGEQAFRDTGECGFRFAAAMLAMALVHGFVDANFVGVGLEPVLVIVSAAMIALHGCLPPERLPSAAAPDALPPFWTNAHA
jgi:O-antigen ligase